MKMFLILSFSLMVTSCKTNIVDHWDCAEKEENFIKTLVHCLGFAWVSISIYAQVRTFEKFPAAIKKTDAPISERY